jgi:hypothetical protein
MSYAPWTSFAYYNAGDIVSYLNVDYQALIANTNKVPTTLAPNWQVFSVPSAPFSAPFFVDVVGDTFNNVVLSNGTFFNSSDPIGFPTLPYDVFYLIVGYFNLDSGGVDTGDFELQLSGTGIVATMPCNFKAQKGWFGMTLEASYIIPATVDAEAITMIIYNNSGNNIGPFSGNCRMYAIGFPIPSP